MSLVDKFFEADLSEAEADQLEAELLASPEAAERLLALAERDYRAGGLPTPMRGDGGRPKKGLFLMIGAGLALGGVALWLAQSERPQIQVAQEEGTNFTQGHLAAEEAVQPRQQAPVREEKAASVASETAPKAHGKRLGLQVSGAEAGKLKVVVYDAGGRCVRHVYDGPVGEGKHKLAWDGRTDEGGRAQAGRYVIEVQSSAGVSRQEIKL